MDIKNRIVAVLEKRRRDWAMEDLERQSLPGFHESYENHEGTKGIVYKNRISFHFDWDQYQKSPIVSRSSSRPVLRKKERTHTATAFVDCASRKRQQGACFCSFPPRNPTLNIGSLYKKITKIFPTYERVTTEIHVRILQLPLKRWGLSAGCIWINSL